MRPKIGSGKAGSSLHSKANTQQGCPSLCESLSLTLQPPLLSSDQLHEKGYRNVEADLSAVCGRGRHKLRDPFSIASIYGAVSRNRGHDHKWYS